MHSSTITLHDCLAGVTQGRRSGAEGSEGTCLGWHAQVQGCRCMYHQKHAGSAVCNVRRLPKCMDGTCLKSCGMCLISMHVLARSFTTELALQKLHKATKLIDDTNKVPTSRQTLHRRLEEEATSHKPRSSASQSSKKCHA